MTLNQEGTISERAQPAPERTIALVTETEAAAISEPETGPLTTPMPILASVTTSQDIAATPTTAKTLLLLTFGPQFDKTTTPARSEPAQSSTSQSHHTAKLPS